MGIPVTLLDLRAGSGDPALKLSFMADIAMMEQRCVDGFLEQRERWDFWASFLVQLGCPADEAREMFKGYSPRECQVIAHSWYTDHRTFVDKQSYKWN